MTYFSERNKLISVISTKAAAGAPRGPPGALRWGGLGGGHTVRAKRGPVRVREVQGGPGRPPTKQPRARFQPFLPTPER